MVSDKMATSQKRMVVCRLGSFMLLAWETRWYKGTGQNIWRNKFGHLVQA